VVDTLRNPPRVSTQSSYDGQIVEAKKGPNTQDRLRATNQSLRVLHYAKVVKVSEDLEHVIY